MEFINEVKKSEGKLILLLSVLWLIYSFLFNRYSYSFGMVFSIIYTLIFINLNLQQKLYAIVFTLPFTSIFKINSSLPSIMIVLYMIYIIETLVVKKKQICLLDIICITGLAITQTIGVSIYNGSIIGIISFILNILFMRLCILNLKENEDTQKYNILVNVSLIFAISMILSITVADIFPQIPYIVLPEKQSLLMSIDRFSGLNGDPNYYSQLVLVAVSLLVGKINIDNRKIITVLMGIFLIISGFRSRSKSYALTFILLVVLFYIYFARSVIKEAKTYKNVLGFIIITLIGIASVYIVFFNVVIPLIESRTDSGDLLTGRGDIWQSYIYMIKMNPFILANGVGFSNSGNTLSQFLGINKAPHNVYIELLVEVGVVGISFILCILRDLILNFRKIINSEFFIYIMMFAITSIGLSLSSNDAIYILLPMVTLVGKSDHKKKNL